MIIFDEIEEKLQRYVLRIDNEKKYSKIIEIPKSFLKKNNAPIDNINDYKQLFLQNGILHEVNFVNLKKVILNPNGFLVEDFQEETQFFDNSDIKNTIQILFQTKYNFDFTLYPKMLNKLLYYQYILPDKMIEEFQNALKKQLINAIKILEAEEKPQSQKELEILYNKYFYCCCNKLGVHHFEDLFVKIVKLFNATKDNHSNARFINTLTYFDSTIPLNTALFLKKEATKPPKQKFTVTFKTIAAFALVILLLFCYQFVKQNQKVENKPPSFPEMNFFQIFRFDQKRVIENQYNSTNLQPFLPCEFKIENTQFNNAPSSTSNRNKEIVLHNKSKKDIIVIWGNEKGLVYQFLQANGGNAKLKPTKGILKLYTGKKPESTIKAAQTTNTPINFRFGIFTPQDKNVLEKEFDLKKIAPTSRRFILFDIDNSVNIKSEIE